MARVKITRFSPVKTLLIATPLIALIAWRLLETKRRPPPPTDVESCPFIYSFNGEQYIFDAEPYGISICEGLKRTEWCGLPNLKEVNGQYKILVTNELNEIQYIDELKLLVVDHPQGIKVAPDTMGRMHTISDSITPTRAYDRNGNNLLHYISENDWKSWQSRNEEKNSDRKVDMREELIFEFPKPEGAKKAKLVFKGSSTLLSSYAVKEYLDLHGNQVDELYEEMNKLGPLNFLKSSIHEREELYTLKIQVETEHGWRIKGTMYGGGPYISTDRIYPIDISDIPGEKLKIKLTPPAGFWLINYLAVDYSNDLPLEVNQIGASEAISNKGKDVRDLLDKIDKEYLVMPSLNDSSELTFESPPHVDGLDRTIILKAHGFYDILLKKRGKPETKLLERFQAEPGFVVQYMFKEYQEWEKNYLSKINFK